MTYEQLVEIAAAAIIERFTKYSDTPDMRQSRIKMASDDARAALSAIAPHLIARGLGEGVTFKEVLGNLIDKLELIHKDERYKAVWQIAQLHLGPYAGPTYESELAAAKACLFWSQP